MIDRDIKDDFKEYAEIIGWMDKTSRRLVEIKYEYEEKSPKILQKAIEEGVDFKALYGGNSEKTRKQYVNEQLAELVIEKDRLKLHRESDNRRLKLLEMVIDYKLLGEV